jgi:hypothetical protein
MFVWLAYRAYIYVFCTFLYDRPIQIREQTKLNIQPCINNEKWFHSVIVDSAIIQGKERASYS